MYGHAIVCLQVDAAHRGCEPLQMGDSWSIWTISPGLPKSRIDIMLRNIVLRSMSRWRLHERSCDGQLDILGFQGPLIH